MQCESVIFNSRKNKRKIKNHICTGKKNHNEK